MQAKENTRKQLAKVVEKAQDAERRQKAAHTASASVDLNKAIAAEKSSFAKELAEKDKKLRELKQTTVSRFRLLRTQAKVRESSVRRASRRSARSRAQCSAVLRPNSRTTVTFISCESSSPF